MPTEPLTITPDTTVGALLRTYPQLDEPLACLVPAYGALSPALRASVAAGLTIQQLATNGHVPLEPLVTGLRAASGVPDAATVAGDRPAWVTAASRMVTFDARPMLAAGAHPVQAVMAGLAALGDGEVFELLTPFVPGPLTDMARAHGFVAHSVWDGEIVRTCFGRE